MHIPVCLSERLEVAMALNKTHSAELEECLRGKSTLLTVDASVFWKGALNKIIFGLHRVIWIVCGGQSALTK